MAMKKKKLEKGCRGAPRTPSRLGLSIHCQDVIRLEGRRGQGPWPQARRFARHGDRLRAARAQHGRQGMVRKGEPVQLAAAVAPGRDLKAFHAKGDYHAYPCSDRQMNQNYKRVRSNPPEVAPGSGLHRKLADPADLVHHVGLALLRSLRGLLRGEAHHLGGQWLHGRGAQLVLVVGRHVQGPQVWSPAAPRLEGLNGTAWEPRRRRAACPRAPNVCS